MLFHYNLVVLAVAQFLVFCPVALSLSKIPTITTRQGRTVELATIQKVLRSATLQHAPKLLYQLDSLDLHCPDGRLLRLSELTTVKKTERLKNVTVVVDNIERNVAPSVLTVREGNGFTLVTDDDDFVHGIWGPSLALTPVHANLHPGLLLNVQRNAIRNVLSSKQDQPITFDNDSVMPDYGPYDIDQALSSPKVLSQEEKCSSLNICRTIRIAAASDRGLCERFSSKRNPFRRSRNHILARVLLADAPFERQTCLRLSVVHFEMQCDPKKEDLFGSYSKNDGISVVYDFQSTWNADMRLAGIRRELAMFFPSYYDFTTTAGVAFVGPVCVKRWAYAWAEGFQPAVIAHEIGHILNARHADTGLMQAFWYPGTRMEFAEDSLVPMFAQTDLHAASFSDCLLTCGAENSPLPTSSRTPVPSTPAASRSPTPSSTPKSSNTCASGFNKSVALDCSKTMFGIKSFSGMQLSLKVVQKAGLLKLKFRLSPNGSVMKTLGLATSMTNDFNGVPLNSVKLLPDGQATKTVTVNPDALKLPAGSSTCCGKQLYVRVLVKACNPDNSCLNVRRTYEGNLSCSPCASRSSTCQC